MEQITVGCWIDSQDYGPVVCCAISDSYFGCRYEATDAFGKIIWVGCFVDKSAGVFQGPSDDLSQEVLKLCGPYGRDRISEDEPDIFEDFSVKYKNPPTPTVI